MTFRIDYDKRIQDSLRQAIRQILQDVSKDGLPGNHHFYISFKSTFPGVEMSEWLLEKYPEEMTIVIQNWFEDLSVSDNDFTIVLNFNNCPERMRVPLLAILNFSDPSVNFSLQFEVSGDDHLSTVPEVNTKKKRNPDGSEESNKEKLVEIQNDVNKNAFTKAIEEKDNIIDFESFRKSD